MMTTRWSLFTSVVKDRVVLIFVGGKERGGDRHVFRSETTFQVNYSYLFLLTNY